MASRKKQRKAARQSRKSKTPRMGPFRHPDGDRRHRGEMTYEAGLALKRLMQQCGAESQDEQELATDEHR
jgi:hypothetical protein